MWLERGPTDSGTGIGAGQQQRIPVEHKLVLQVFAAITLLTCYLLRKVMRGFEKQFTVSGRHRGLDTNFNVSIRTFGMYRIKVPFLTSACLKRIRGLPPDRDPVVTCMFGFCLP